ncbi:MAG: hypothetical protein PHZ00_03165 [Candidatus Peribacteraceae bacterium]|nr:hypothetical protein [Candidatus Peribacteraceae bacterium]
MSFPPALRAGNFTLRLSLGVTMAFIGITAYRDFVPFVELVTDGLGGITFLGYVWAFFLPALLIFGGVFLVIGRYLVLAAWTGGLALASVPIGMVLKTVMTGLPLPDMLAASYPVIVWLLAFVIALKTAPDEDAS